MIAILKIRIQNEMDIVLAQKRAKQLCQYTGMNLSTQTKFATAVSEMCRNVHEHVGEGYVQFNIVEEDQAYLEAQVVDYGRGIYNVESLTSPKLQNANQKGSGIANSKKLVDHFAITSESEKGTKVTLRNKILSNKIVLNNSIIKGWKHHFEQQKDISPYEEIKNQNISLIEMTDSLQLKQLETEHQLAEIKRLNRELDQFAYVVSHDLKAPLRNIQGLLNALIDSLEDKDIADATNIGKMAMDQTLFLDKLIHDILSYSKLGRQNIQKTKVHIHSLVKDVLLSQIRPETMVIVIENSMPILFSEEIFLYQIFSNLISNAIRYHHSVIGQIEVGSKLVKGELIFFVKDDGPGISKEAQERVFNLFESTGDQKDSTGIGLSIVKNIIKQKGSRIWVESDGIKGSIFYFTWPVSEIWEGGLPAIS